MQKEEEEAAAFCRSGKLARSPVGVLHGDSESDTDPGSKKRKERSGKTQEKLREKRSRKSPVEVDPLDVTECESGDLSAGVVIEECLGGGDVGEMWAATSEIKQWFSNQYKSKKIVLFHMLK